MGIKTNVENIDTNHILRLIVQDNPKQLAKARKLLSQNDKIYVFQDAAMIEIVYILSSSNYNFTREQIASDIKSIMQFSNLYCNKSIIESSLDVYVSHPKLSFVDCYLAVVTETSAETPLWTFDHKLVNQCPIAKEP